MNSIAAISILLAIAIIVEHVVAWAGSVLHSVPSPGENEYAVFTFQTNQEKPLTVNILMNIAIPNVVMIFTYMVATCWNLEKVVANIVLLVAFYYLYRAFLICVLLRRKELYSVGYELTIAIIAIVIANFLNEYFFVDARNVFIDISELTNELWLAIFLVLYKFVQLILDKWMTQGKITTDSMMEKYIKKRFTQLYRKYGSLVEVNIKNRYICIFMYAIMIFEDYNRGYIVRIFERIKFLVTGKGTLGIMQVSTEVMISDEESVQLAYAQICENIGSEFDETEISWYAWNYNNSDDYSSSIENIYKCLKEYLWDVPRWRKVFRLDEDMETETDVNSESETEQIYENVEELLTIEDITMMTGKNRMEVIEELINHGVILSVSENKVKEIWNQCSTQKE